MWAKAYRKFPHSNQDTNNAIESCHRYLKQRYIDEKNNAFHRRVDWCIHVLLESVEPYYIHMQHLKQVGILRPRKSREQLARSKRRANEILDEECVCDENNNNEYWVHNQNNNTRDTWYKVIYRSSEFFLCGCDRDLNGNVCKHVIKVGMV